MPPTPTERTIKVDGTEVVVRLRPRSSTQATLLADYQLPVSRTRRRPSTGTTDPQKALTALDHMIDTQIAPDIRQDLATGAVQEYEQAGDVKQNPTIARLSNWYLTVHLPYKGVSPATMARADHVLREFELWAKAHHIGRIGQISMSKIEEYAAWAVKIGGEKRAPKTVHNHVSQLRSWLIAAVESGELDNSPVKKWLLPRIVDKDVKVLSWPDVLALVAAVAKHQPDYYAPIAMAAHTGLRIADVIDLRIEQVLPDRITRIQNKTSNRVAIPMTPDIRTALSAATRESTAPQGRVFVHPRLRTPFRKNSLLRAVKTAAEKADLKFVPTVKILRASWATHLADRGCPPKILMELMGHTDIKMTLKYYVRAGFDQAAIFLNGLSLEPTVIKSAETTSPKKD